MLAGPAGHAAADTEGCDPMSEPVDPMEAILLLCADAAPEPWYPSAYAKESGVPREQFDEPLERLRMAGLLRLTDWVQGRGQGYALTPAGEAALRSPRLRARLKRGDLPPARPAPEPAFQPGDPTTFDRGEAVRDALMRPARPVVTQVLIGINLVVFAAGLVMTVLHGGNLNQFIFQGNDRALALTGAVSGVSLLRGEWWRLLTCCFVHFGLLHLAMNMYSLYAIGTLVERLWGRWRYLYLYLVAGLGGSCAAMLSDPRVHLAGASGAIWGLMTALAAWIMLNRRHLPPPLVSAWLRNLGTVFMLNVLISLMPGISAAGHFGGGAVGFLVAALLNANRFGRPAVRAVALAAMVLIPLAGFAAVQRAMWTDPRWNQIAQAEEARLDSQDVERFNKDALQRVWGAYQRAEALYKDAQVNDLLDRRPAARDPKAVAALREQIQGLLGEVRQDADAVNRAGPYQSERVQRAWQAGQRLIEEQLRWLELLDTRLEKGAGWTDEEAKQYGDVEEGRREARKEWDRALKAS
jgi:membrane associated rhomboid family serine protease